MMVSGNSGDEFKREAAACFIGQEQNNLKAFNYCAPISGEFAVTELVMSAGLTPFRFPHSIRA
ncbi:hypothetical protein ACLBWS_12820 [Brucellaceae bacterium D45D]